MNAGPWSPGCDSFLEAVPSLIGRLWGWGGQWASEGRTAGRLLSCFLTCYFRSSAQ